MLAKFARPGFKSTIVMTIQDVRKHSHNRYQYVIAGKSAVESRVWGHT